MIAPNERIVFGSWAIYFQLCWRSVPSHLKGFIDQTHPNDPPTYDEKQVYIVYQIKLCMIFANGATWIQNKTNDCCLLYRIVPYSDTNTLLHSYLPINILPTDSDIPSHAAFRRKEVLQQKTGLAQISTVRMNLRRHKMIYLSHSICYHLIKSNILVLPSIHIIYPSIHLSNYLSIHLSTYLFIHLSHYLSTYL